MAPRDPCPIDHAVAKADPDWWARQKYVGIMDVPEDATGPAERLELRNCTCGTTLAIHLPLSHP